MLKERNIFAEELPVNVITACIDEYPRHFHDDIEVVYVISGKISVQNGYYKYALSQGDITIINEKEIHSFEKITPSNMVMMVRINLDYFETYYKNLRNSFFIINDRKSEKEYIQAMREILACIMMDILKKGYGYEHKVIESTHNLLTCMLTNFKMDDGVCAESDAKSNGKRILTIRLRRIMDYMYENYKSKITLEELAGLEHLSIYYLSHIIKEATGLSFQDLLSFIRVDESESLLLNTDKKIGTISKEMGFSALRYYKKHFEQWFLCDPCEYRNNFKGETAKRNDNARYVRCSVQEIEEAIKQNTSLAYTEYIKAKKHLPVIINLDFADLGTVKQQNVSFIGDLMCTENLKFIERPYVLFKSLNEKLAGYGMNYIISFIENENVSGIDRVTILLYNITDDEKRELIISEKKEQIFELCSKRDDSHEFLIKLKNIAGIFEVTRYKISRENVLAAYRELIRPSGIAERRKSLLSNWETIPSIERSKLSAIGNLNLRSNMSGISAEMILLDRIK
ncbi:MAG: helix-turn-helix domain-containing protein [Eubacteriales bacterium]